MNNYHPLLLSFMALLGLVSACSEQALQSVATTVCELPSYVQRTVQLDAAISVNSEGNAVIGDLLCASTKIELRLSATALRAGAAEQLTAAAKSAKSSGNPSFPMKLTGVFTNDSTGSYFVADSIARLPASR